MELNLEIGKITYQTIGKSYTTIQKYGLWK